MLLPFNNNSLSRFLIVALSRSKHQLYIAALSISIITSAFVFNGATIIDEVLNLFLAMLCVLILFTNTQKNKATFKNIKIEIVMLMYLLLNSIISLYLNSDNSKLRNYNESTLRFIVVYVAMIIFVFTFNTIPQDFSNVIKVSIILFSVNLYIWIMYWLILKFHGVNWELEQAKSYSGSTYAALLPAFGLLLHLVIFKNSSNKFLRTSFVVNYLLTLLATYMYSSRVLFGVLLIVSIILIVNMRKVIPVILFVISIIFVVFTQSIFTAGVSSNYQTVNKDKANFFSTEKFNEFKSSINFVFNPRLTDGDRSSQIKCSITLITDSASFKEEVFGFGQSVHKSMMYRCAGLDPSTPGAPARPVGIAAFILDYGLVGVCLGLLLFFKLVFLAFRSKNTFTNLVILFLIPGWLFVANVLDHSFIYIILFLNFIYRFNKQIGVSSE